MLDCRHNCAILLLKVLHACVQELQQLNAIDRLLSVPQSDSDSRHSATRTSTSVSRSFVVSSRQSADSVAYQRTSLIRILSLTT